MTEPFKRHGVLVTPPQSDSLSHVSEAEQRHKAARVQRARLRYQLEHRGYPGNVTLIPHEKDLWLFRLDYGFNYYLAEALPSPGAYPSADAALDAAIKLIIEGRKLSKGKPQRDVSAMTVAMGEKEKREGKRRKGRHKAKHDQ